MRRSLLLLLAVLLLVAPGARAAGPAATGAAIDRQMDRAGAASGALVVDLDSGDTLYSARADVPRVPASVNKLNTTAAALLRFGPAATLDTVAVTATEPDELGRIPGDVWLRGGGDPTFGPEDVGGLAAAVDAAGITEIGGVLRADESLFDGLRGPHSLAPSRWVDPLSALGFARPRTADPARAAGSAMVAALKAVGIPVRRRVGVGRAPAAAIPIAAWPSPPMAALIAAANVPSDNYVAEMLLKAMGAEFRGVGTTRAGARVAQRALREIGVRARISDGSGLSRANRISPRQVVALLRAVAVLPDFPAFEASLPIAGRTGTLSERLRRTAAQDACRAKTGSLIGVSALAGYCLTVRGGRVAFAFLMNGISVPWARTLQDRMVAALARYDGTGAVPEAPLRGTDTGGTEPETGGATSP